MTNKTFTYDPAKLLLKGKDLMRFELGDTDTDGEEESAFLCDEEITAMLQMHPKWSKAKLALVETVCRRFSFETDISVSGLSLPLQARASAWKTLYDELKANQAKSAAPYVNEASMGAGHADGGEYFKLGMMDNTNASRGGRN